MTPNGFLLLCGEPGNWKLDIGYFLSSFSILHFIPISLYPYTPILLYLKPYLHYISPGMVLIQVFQDLAK